VPVRFSSPAPPSPAQREVPAQRACRMWVSIPLGSPRHTPPLLRWTSYLACERVLASSIREGRTAVASETGHAPTANETGPVTPDSIMEVARGFMAAKHLFAASSIGIFEALADGPATLAEIAARAGISERAAHISADAMVALGSADVDQLAYSNGAVASPFLAGRPPPDLRPFLRLQDLVSYPAWMQLEPVLRGP